MIEECEWHKFKSVITNNLKLMTF